MILFFHGKKLYVVGVRRPYLSSERVSFTISYVFIKRRGTTRKGNKKKNGTNITIGRN